MSHSEARAGDDPAPQPPAPPGLDDCCRSGCVPCVFDLYEDALERYRTELKAWRQRHGAPEHKNGQES